MKKATKSLASVTEGTDSQELVLSITKGRQEIESGIFRNQFRNSTVHLIEKGWYTAWLAFISGKYLLTLRYCIRFNIYRHRPIRFYSRQSKQQQSFSIRWIF